MRKAAVALLLAFGAGCTVLPPAPAAPQLYDLGPTSASAAPAGASHIATVQVTAPEWLGGDQIHYRLSFDDPNRLRSYALHRFVAPPAALVRERLREALTAARAADAPAGGATCNLNLVLQTFEQRFASRAAASVVVALRAELARPGVAPFAVRPFSWRRASAPDAPGAARALAALTDEAVRDVLGWAAPLCAVPRSAAQ